MSFCLFCRAAALNDEMENIFRQMQMSRVTRKSVFGDGDTVGGNPVCSEASNLLLTVPRRGLCCGFILIVNVRSISVGL